MEINAESLQKLEQRQIIWLASVRPDGRPHLAPVWFVFYRGKFFVGTDRKSVKVRNLENNPHAALALEDGLHPVICQAIGSRLRPPWDDGVLERFRQKYAWDLTAEEQYNDLWQFTPQRWLAW